LFAIQPIKVLIQGIEAFFLCVLSLRCINQID